MREANNNDNGSQGTTIESVNVKMELKLNTCGITQSNANDEDLSLDAKNLP